MDLSRRKFLKFLLIGTGALFLSRVLEGGLFASLNSSGKKRNLDLSSTNLNALSGGGIKAKPLGREFRVVEHGGHLVFYSQRGEKVFSVNREGEMIFG